MHEFDNLPLIDGSILAEHSLTKDQAFLNANARSGYVYSSGGTTGKPKFSFYSYEEFTTIGKLLGKSYQTNGLTVGEHVANLFMAGNMWSSFNAIQEALRACDVVQYPMGAQVAPSDFKNYIKDPSNKDEKFLRIRVRKYKRSMEKEGLDTNKIIKTVNNLVSANQAINFYKNRALHEHTSFASKKKCVINKKIFKQEAGEIVFKSFSEILSLISGTYYPTRSKKIVSLIERLKKKKFIKTTLGGCIIEGKNNFILITKELKNKKIPKSTHKNMNFIKI